MAIGFSVRSRGKFGLDDLVVRGMMYLSMKCADPNKKSCLPRDVSRFATENFLAETPSKRHKGGSPHEGHRGREGQDGMCSQSGHEGEVSISTNLGCRMPPLPKRVSNTNPFRSANGRPCATTSFGVERKSLGPTTHGTHFSVCRVRWHGVLGKRIPFGKVQRGTLAFVSQKGRGLRKA